MSSSSLLSFMCSSKMLNANKYYKDYFLFSEACGDFQRSRSDGIFKTEDIDKDIKVGTNLINEKEMIESRAHKTITDDAKICAYHRYNLGTLWKTPKYCVHPSQQKPDTKNWRASKKSKDLRPASMNMYERINSSFPLQFPMFGNVCTEHRKETTYEEEDQNENDPDYLMNDCDEFHSFFEQSPAAYVHSGNDCLSASDIKKGILYQGGHKNTKVSEVEIDRSKCEITHSKVKDIQSFHSVRFHQQGMIFWRYFDCGAGRYEPFQELGFLSGLSVVSEYSDIHHVSVFASKKRADRELCNLFFCSHAGCIDSFQSDDELSVHITLNDHHFHSTDVSNLDSVKAHYAKLMHEASHTITSQNQPSKSFPLLAAVENCSLYSEVNKYGWALPKRTNSKFNKMQRQFLYEEF